MGYAAANIADLRVLSLIEENTAAALHYGIDRVFDEPHHVLYYNLGANSLQVSIMRYSSYTMKEAGKNKTVGQFEVVGKSWKSSIGGAFVDVKLAELLADRFNEMWKKKKNYKGEDIRQFVRPMTRLRTVKVKEVLSANNEFPVKIEQLHADVDLVTKVTRADLEKANEDLFSQLLTPIQEALAMAEVSLEDINAVELLGGGVRMPKVKRMLEEYFKPAKLDLGQHLNGDEAMALGGAFRAANLSTAFRVRKVGVQDISTFGVSLKLETLPSKPGFFGSLFGSSDKKKESSGEEWTKMTPLYPRKSNVPSKVKTVAFNYDKDILCRIEYDQDADTPLPIGTDRLLAVYNITGIAEFAKETESKGLGQPKVHLSFSLDSSGVVALNKAEATVDLPQPEPTEEEKAAVEAEEDKEAAADGEKGTVKPEAEEKDRKTEEENDGEKSEEKAEGDAVDEDGEKDEKGEKIEEHASEDDKKTEKPKEKPKKDKKKEKKVKADKKETQLRRILTIVDNPSLISPPSWTEAELDESKARLEALDYEDRKRLAREKALNELESYVYKIKNRLMDDEVELSKVSTEEQRTELSELTQSIQDWLDEEVGPSVDVLTFNEKQSALGALAEPIFKRYSELTSRPAAVKKAKDQLAAVKTTVGKWHETMPHVTDEEKSKLLDLVEKASNWIEDKEEAQKKITAFEPPAFESADVMPQLKTVTLNFEKLLRKPKPPPEKPKKNETVTVNTTGVNSTDAENKTDADTQVAGDADLSDDTAADEAADADVNTDAKTDAGNQDSVDDTADTKEDL